MNINKFKTKCVIFNKSNIDSNNICPIILNGVPLPYVDEFKHLGNLFQSDNSMYRDCNVKRAKFISIIHSLNQEFHFFEPTMVVKLYKFWSHDKEVKIIFSVTHIYNIYIVYVSYSWPSAWT